MVVKNIESVSKRGLGLNMVQNYSSANLENKIIPQRTVGVLNIILGIVLLIDVGMLCVVAFCLLMLSFSLFFMAAIPAFLLFFVLTIATFVAAVINLVDGIATVAVSKKRRILSSVLGVITIIVDLIMIIANIVALVCGIYLTISEVNFISITTTITASLAIILAILSLCLTLIRNKQLSKIHP